MQEHVVVCTATMTNCQENTTGFKFIFLKAINTHKMFKLISASENQWTCMEFDAQSLCDQRTSSLSAANHTYHWTNFFN